MKNSVLLRQTNVFRKLCESNTNNVGNLLEINWNKQTGDAQIQAWMLETRGYSIVNLIEIGTNKAFLPYALLENKKKLIGATIDKHKDSAVSMKVLSDNYEHQLDFYNMLSDEYFAEHRGNRRFDFGWLDGGRDAKQFKRDLFNLMVCVDEKILIDDYKNPAYSFMHQIISDSIKNTAWKFRYSYTFENDDRGIVILQKNA